MQQRLKQLAWRMVQRAGERFHESRAAPAKCNHQDLLSSLSVLPRSPRTGSNVRVCMGIRAF
jgi:hypothetical protein